MTKKLIEIGIPLEAVNVGSKPETENPFLRGHPRSLHNWWARTPLSVCRSILFAQLINDPVDELGDSALSRSKRKVLLELVAKLATYDAIKDHKILTEARKAINEQFAGKPPTVWDMFAGRGSIPLEAMRLGCHVVASDLNPIPFAINTALLRMPQRFHKISAISPGTSLLEGGNSTSSLVQDILFYANELHERSLKKIADLFPEYPVDAKEQSGNPFYSIAKSQKISPNALLWARTVRCPNPQCRSTAPLVTSLVLAKREKIIFLQPLPTKAIGTFFEVRVGDSKDVPPPIKQGRGAKFKCLCCDQNISDAHLQAEGVAGRLGHQLLCAVASVGGKLAYLNRSEVYEKAALSIKDENCPEEELAHDPRNIWCKSYGLNKVGDLFTQRQSRTFGVWLDEIDQIKFRILKAAENSGQFAKDDRSFGDGGSGAKAYSDAICTYLVFAISRLTDYQSCLATWNPENENVRNVFQRQALPMAWDYCEASPIAGKLTYNTGARWIAEGLEKVPSDQSEAFVRQVDATNLGDVEYANLFVCTDPPYFDNISYASLGDFFYVWLRRGLKKVFPDQFGTILTPKEKELVAAPYRHDGNQDEAAEFVRSGFSRFYASIRSKILGDSPITIYYSFRQSEEENSETPGVASTGWETMLDGLVSGGFVVTGTLPVRTSKKARSVARGTNALASAIVLVCRVRQNNESVSTRSEFLKQLKRELPVAIQGLKNAGIAAVDLAQSAIGPGMEVFSRCSKILEADGTSMTVRTALALINQVLDEVNSESEGDLDKDSRWCVSWFESHGFDTGEFGEANVLATAKATSVSGLEEAGVLIAKAGKVRLIAIDDLDDSWDPSSDKRLTIWELTHHLIKRLDSGGEDSAAELVAKVGALSESARDLAYRLYGICERKKWAKEALRYNALVIAWSNIIDRARLIAVKPTAVQSQLSML